MQNYTIMESMMRIPMGENCNMVFAAEVLLIKQSEFQRINVIWSPWGKNSSLQMICNRIPNALGST